jgi:arabinogalactan endo-1,4-beta-galactosidase
MNAVQKKRDEALNAIGRELDDCSQAGTLDFEMFKAMLQRAIAAVGSDNEHLEMFCHYATGEGWFAWMVQELQKAPSRRVA